MVPFATSPLREAVVFDTCDWLEVTDVTAPSLITPWDSCVCPTITVDPCCRPDPGLMILQSSVNPRRADEKKESVKGGCVDVQNMIVAYPSMSLHKKIKLPIALKFSI